MTARQLEGIMGACAKAIARELVGKLPGQGEAGRKPAVTLPKEPEPTRAAVTALTDKEHEKQNRETLELEEARLKQAQLDLMQIENPWLYEQLMLHGELEDAPGEKNA